MQHGDVMKKCNFDLLTPSPGSGGGGGGCGQNICYHVAAFIMPLNLICNKTISVKVKVWPTDRFGRVGVCGKSICYRDSLYMQHDLVLKKFKFDLLNPSPGSGLGGVRQIFATMLLHL